MTMNCGWSMEFWVPHYVILRPKVIDQEWNLMGLQAPEVLVGMLRPSMGLVEWNIDHYFGKSIQRTQLNIGQTCLRHIGWVFHGSLFWILGCWTGLVHDFFGIISPGLIKFDPMKLYRRVDPSRPSFVGCFKSKGLNIRPDFFQGICIVSTNVCAR